MIGDRIDDLFDEMSGHPFHLVTLLPSFETVVERWRAVDSPFIDAWSWMDEAIRERTERVGLWLDTTTMAPQQVVADVIDRPDESLVRR